MTANVKVAICSLLGFCMPVAVVFLASPLILSKDSPANDYSRAILSHPDEGTGGEPLDVVATASSLHAIQSRPEFDPSTAKPFIVSLSVQFDALPENGERVKFASKYANETMPYSGWAVGLRELNGRLRPQVYWRLPDGSGGWYTFADVEIVPKDWYSFSFMHKPDGTLTFYLDSLDRKGLKQNNPSIFKGGYPIESHSVPGSEEPLYFGRQSEGEALFRGEVGEIVIAHLDEKKLSRKKLDTLLAGSPKEIVGRLEKSEIAFHYRQAREKTS